METSPPSRNLYDRFFRQVFSISEAARDYCLKFLEPEILQWLDLATLEPEKNDFVDERMVEAFSDVSYRCSLKNVEGQEVRVSFLFEHKSEREDFPHVQLLKYIVRRMEEDLAQKRPLRLTVPIVVYHGEAAWESKPLHGYFPSLPAEFRRYLPEFDYGLTDLTTMPREVIVQAIEGTILANALLALKYGRDWGFVKAHFNETFIFGQAILKTPEGKYFRRIFAIYFTYLFQKKEDFMEMVQQMPLQTGQSFKSVAEQLIEEGMEKGIKRGMEKGIEKMLLRGFPAQEVAE
ncbi:MAG: Rpn family recombination-promoting nuclease/putative transposase, partial [Saprospiraceae bacterium]